MTPEREADLKFQASVLIRLAEASNAATKAANLVVEHATQDAKSHAELLGQIAAVRERVGNFELKKSAAVTGVLLLLAEVGKVLILK